MSEFEIKKLEQKHVLDVFEIEKSLIGNCTMRSILNTLESETNSYFVLEKDGKVIGFFECLIITPEAELFDIAIEPGYQGKGYSKMLMNYFFELCKNNKVETIFLEVNNMNSKAQNLYKKFGFEQYSVRKNYYGDNDAILMKCKIDCE